MPSKATECGMTACTLVVAVGELGELSRSLSGLVGEGAMVLLTTSREAAARWLLAAPPSSISFDETDSPSVSEIGRLRICLKEARVTWAGAQLPLSASELRIVALLADEPGRMFTFEEISRAAWGDSCFGDSSATRSAIGRIRKKLLVTRGDIRIESARGLGFRLLCEASEAPLPSAIRQEPKKLGLSRLTG